MSENNIEILQKVITKLKEVEDVDYNPIIMTTYYNIFDLDDIIEELDRVIVHGNEEGRYSY